MNARTVCACVGMSVGAASVVAQGERPQLQMLDVAIEVSPLRVAKVRYEDGRVRVVSEWNEYELGTTGRRKLTRVYDCFGDDDSDGFMDDTNNCFSNSTSRWFFGSAYCNMFVTNDHTVWDQTDIDAGFQRVDLAWYWTCSGSGTESCYIAVVTQDSVPCEPDSFDYSGWVFDYGDLDCNPGAGYYFYTNTELSTGNWPISAGGTGSHTLLFAQDVTSSGGLVVATCAQPMLWGSGIAGGASNTMRGTQNELQFDDDNPIDGLHSFAECYDYTHECPDPLGAMVQFWGDCVQDGDCSDADVTGDGMVDTQDFIAYLNLWADRDDAAECNGDGRVNSQDVLCFLIRWNECRC